MKILPLLLSATTAVSTVAYAATAGDAARAWAEAVLNRDAKALEQILSDDLYFALADGRTVQTKASYVASTAKGPVHEKFELRSPAMIRLYDRLAVLSGYVDVKQSMSDSASLRVLQLYVQKNGEWRLEASSSTGVAAPRANAPQRLSSPSGGSVAYKENSIGNHPGDGVMAAAVGWTEAAVRKDVTDLEKYLEDDLIFVHSNGSTIQDKAQYLAATPRNTYEALPMSSVDIRRFGSLALLTAYIDTKNTGREPFRVRTFQVFVERDGHWRLAAFQSTRVASTANER